MAIHKVKHTFTDKKQALQFADLHGGRDVKQLQYMRRRKGIASSVLGEYKVTVRYEVEVEVHTEETEQ